MSQSEQNLREAFAGESQANRKYSVFADKAKEEGYEQVARLFRAASLAEAFHARNHLRALKGIGPTAENLRAAISGENYEHTSMYPGFIDQAKGEGEREAQVSFDWALKVERIHEGLYKRALEGIQSGKDMVPADMWVCGRCGNTLEGGPPDQCPICGVPKSMFVAID